MSLKGQFNDAGQEGGAETLGEKVLGVDYDYSSKIKEPSKMGMSGDGNFGALANDIAGLMGYVDLLVTGKCQLGACASDPGHPLGSKFFVETPVQCTDKATEKSVKRSIYINNVPDGSLPFISDGNGLKFDSFTGLVPGIMSNLAQLNPMKILTAFTDGPATTCQAITMPTIDANDNTDVDTKFVTNKDIRYMNPDWFSVPGNPKPSLEQLKEIDDETTEEFTGMKSKSSLTDPTTLKGSKIDYSKLPNNLLIKFYISSLGLLGLYMFIKIMFKNKRVFKK